MIKDEHRIVLYSVLASILVWITNAMTESFLFLNGSFWDTFIFNITDFENYYRLTTLAIFIAYGVIASNIIARKRRWGENLLKSKAKMHALLHAIPDVLLRIRGDGTLLESVTEKENGSIELPERFLGKNIVTFLPPEATRKSMEHIERSIETGDMQIFEYQIARGDERSHHEGRIVKTGSDEVLAILRDISDRKELEEKLRNLSLTDELTGMNNRRGFFLLSEQQLKLANRHGKGILLFYVDFDDMKWINDTLGHRSGDDALVETGKILRSTFRESDIIARVGGDEFAVLMIDIQGADVEEIVAKRLEKNVRELNAKLNREYRLSLSIGAARYDPQSPCTIDELLARADASMYREKKRKQAITAEKA